MRRLKLYCAIVLGLTLMAGVAHAEPRIDQSQLNTSWSTAFNSDYMKGQTFTVGVTGKLAAVDIYVSVESMPSTGYRFDLRPTVNGAMLENDTLASVELSAPTSYQAQLVTVDLTSFDLNVTIGDVLGFTLRGSTPGINNLVYLGDSNPYPGGTDWYTQWYDGHLGVFGNGDLAFRTWVEPAPAPMIGQLDYECFRDETRLTSGLSVVNRHVQTFKAGKSGQLSRVDVRIIPLGIPTAGIVIQVRGTTHGAPNGNLSDNCPDPDVLACGTVPFPTASGEQWVILDLGNRGVPVVAGQELAIVVGATAPAEFGGYNYNIRGTDGLSPEGPCEGNSYLTADGRTWRLGSGDWFLRTYVTPTPANNPPLTNAGKDQTVDENATVILNGTSSIDPDGDPLVYLWTQVGGTSVALEGADTSQANFTAPNVSFGGETLTFQLTVTDPAGLSNTDHVDVTVANVNHIPVALAVVNNSDPANVPENTMVTLDGTGSYDEDNDLLAYSWWQESGDQPVEIYGDDAAQPTFQAPVVDPSGLTLTFHLGVSDGYGGSAEDTVVVNVQYSNQQPSADAGSDQIVNEATIVTLDGSGSSDPDQNPVTYTWTAPDRITLDLADPQKPGFTAPEVSCLGERLTFELTVADGYGGTATDTVEIAVENINNSPTASAGSNQSVPEETAVRLDGSGSDIDGESLSYRWAQTSGPGVILSNPDSAAPDFTAPRLDGSIGGDPNAKETLTFELTVGDTCGAETKASTVVVVANQDHEPIARPEGPVSADEGSAVSLDGSSSMDPDGDALTYSWSQAAGPAVVLSGAHTGNAGFTAPFVGPGGTTLSFKLTVADPYGGVSSAMVNVFVKNINDPPSCDQAQATTPLVWPPNHKMLEFQIVGVADPNSNSVLEILKVAQDEPVNGQGDGDTSPDAVIQHEKALLRAERSGTGNGRVYTITFQASDFEGACSGTVQVCVPTSQKTNNCFDDGQLYNSIKP